MKYDGRLRQHMSGWVSGELRGAQRRRLIAVLRMAHKVLGMGRKRLALGLLGAAGTCAAIGVVGIGAVPANAQYVSTNDVKVKGCSIGAANATASGDVAIGCGATSSSGTDTWHANIAFGVAAQAASGNRNIAIGLSATTGSNVNDALAIGYTAAANQSGAIAIGSGAIASHANSVVLGFGSVSQSAVTTASGVIAGTTYTYAGASSSVVSVGTTTTKRQIVNVAAGRVTATSTDAVNGSQLLQTQVAISTVASSLSTGVSSLSTSTSTALSDTNSNVASLSTSTSTGISSLSTGVSSLSTSTSTALSNTNSNVASLSASTSTGISSLSTGLSETNSNVASLSTSTSTGISSLSTGVSSLSTSTSTALSDTNSNVAALRQDALLWNSTLGAYDASHGTDSPQKITNVAPGDVTATSTDAVNGRQLYSLSTSTSTGISSLSTSTSTALSDTNSNVASLSTGISEGTIGAVRYGQSPSSHGSASTSPDELYLQPGSGTGPVVLHNVGAGSLAAGSTDAVNGGQINNMGESLAAALGGGSTFNSTTGFFTAPNYVVAGSNYSSVGGAITALDSGLSSVQNNLNVVADRLGRQIDENREIAAAGISGAMAMGQIRYDDRPGRQTIGVGSGLYDGQSSIAVGYGFTSGDGEIRGNAALSYSPGVDKLGVGVGLSYSW